MTFFLGHRFGHDLDGRDVSFTFFSLLLLGIALNLLVLPHEHGVKTQKFIKAQRAVFVFVKFSETVIHEQIELLIAELFVASQTDQALSQLFFPQDFVIVHVILGKQIVGLVIDTLVQLVCVAAFWFPACRAVGPVQRVEVGRFTIISCNLQ